MQRKRLWLARAFIFAVLFFNVQCALVFIYNPGAFVGGFELSGAAGEGVVRGFGILFLMWNVPYMVAVTEPIARRLSLYEAVAMQSIGFVGESLLLMGFEAGHPLIAETIGRFIIFDGVGLVLLIAAVLVTSPLTGFQR